MNAKIATGLFALTFMFMGTANAGILPDGEYWFSNSNKMHSSEPVEYKSVMTVKKVGTRGKDGIYQLTYGPQKDYYHTASSNEGAQLLRDQTKGNNWVLVENSDGTWTILHEDNGANAISNIAASLKLRRNNAGGRGNSDQVWKFTRR